MHKEIKDRISALIEISGYRDDFVAKKIGMALSDFSVKKEKCIWSEKEVTKILDVLTAENDAVFDLLMLEEMRLRKDDETFSLAEYKKELGWK
jgi:hypothetical protein